MIPVLTIAAALLADSRGARRRDRPLVVSLYDLSGNWSRPWLASHDVLMVDHGLQPGLSAEARGDSMLFHVGMDVPSFVTAWPSIRRQLGLGEPDVLLAAPPCRVFSSAGARLWPDWDASGETDCQLQLIDTVLQLVQRTQPRVWALENPPGRLYRLPGWSTKRAGGPGLRQAELSDPTFSFHPWHFAALAEDPQSEAHSKQTYLWGVFSPPVKAELAPAPRRGRDWTSSLSSTDPRRWTTPTGFSKAFYEANSSMGSSPSPPLPLSHSRAERA